MLAKMLGYRHILFLTHLSAHDKWVGARAVSLAQQFSARLTILHVFSQSELREANVVYFPIEKHIRHVRSKLSALGKELIVPLSDQKLIVGEPEIQLAEQIEKWQIDLVVMSARDSSLVANCHCDVFQMSRV